MYTHVNDVVLVGVDSVYYTQAFNISNEKIEKLVIFIPGSGPTDRDGNSLMMSGKGNTFKMLADSLSKYGFASIRYDKPGIGKSTLKGGEASLLFTKNVEVVQALFDAHKNKYKQIYVAGHSEGALVGMLAAQNLNLAGYISLAGPARNAADVLKSQLSESPGLTTEMKQECMANIDSLKNGDLVKQYNPLLASLFRPSVQPYLISWFAYTPTQEIAKLDIPVLIIVGEADVQVPAAAGEALDHFAKNSTLKSYPKVNHVLKTVENDVENKASYGDASIGLSNQLVHDLVSWLQAN